MAGHHVPFAAFLMESHPRAPALQKIILDPERHYCADAGEGEPISPSRARSRSPMSSLTSIEFSSCQLLAQTTHHYTLAKKGGKPALEHTSQGMQRVKLDTDQPSMLPAQHAGHGA